MARSTVIWHDESSYMTRSAVIWQKVLLYGMWSQVIWQGERLYGAMVLMATSSAGANTLLGPIFVVVLILET